MAGDLSDDELTRWAENSSAMSDEHRAQAEAISRVMEAASAHGDDCDVCAVVVDLAPRDVLDYLWHDGAHDA
jgi:hypothetical protein